MPLQFSAEGLASSHVTPGAIDIGSRQADGSPQVIAATRVHHKPST
jgi:hypothetical protein